MEIEQLNIKLFQDGLTDVLNNPWEEPEIIKDTIPSLPAGGDEEDRKKHNLIKFHFYLQRLFLPYYFVVRHLCLNKKYFLTYILEYVSKTADYPIFFDNPSRLTSHEIYQAFVGMSLNNASFLLDKINCPLSVYTQLKDSLQFGEETKFAEAIDRCDISRILPVIKFILFVKNQMNSSNSTNSPGQQPKEQTALDIDTEIEKAKEIAIYEHESVLTEKHGVLPNSKAIQDSREFAKLFFGFLDEPDDFLKETYPFLFSQYKKMKDGGAITESDCKAFEYIFHQPAFEEQYNECLKQWKVSVLESKHNASSKKSTSTALEEPSCETAADYDQEIPEELNEKQKDIIKNFYIRDKYFEVTPNKSPNYCTIVNNKFNNLDKVERAKKFKAFIKLLARQHCIAPINVVMQSCAYDFTGIGFEKPYEHVPVFWNKKKVDTLLFICTKFFKKVKNADFVKAVKVFHVQEIYKAMQNPSKVAAEFNCPEFLQEFHNIFGEL